LQIRTAAELVDPELEARWTTRRAARETEVLQAILRRFVQRPDPIVVEEFIRAFPERAPNETRVALTRLDEDDLIQIRDGRVDLAYQGFAGSQHGGDRPRKRPRAGRIDDLYLVSVLTHTTSLQLL